MFKAVLKIKFKILSLPVALLIILWGALEGTTSARAEKGVTEIEKELTQLLTEECNKNVISPLSFPDGFRSQTLFTICDAAFAFEPNQNARQLYSYQRATNEIGNSVPNSQIDYSKKFFLKKLDPFDDSFKSLLSRAKQLDPQAILELSRLSLRTDNDLGYDAIKQNSLGPDALIELLFLPHKKFFKKADSWKKIDVYLTEFLENLHILSQDYTDIATQKILASIDHILVDYNLIEAAFIVPDSLAPKLLSLATFSSSLPSEFTWALRLRVLSPRELNEQNFPGGKSFYKQMPDDVHFGYVFLLMDFENALHDMPNTSAGTFLEKFNWVLDYEKQFPELRGQYQKFFPATISSGILDQSADDIATIFSSILNGDQKFSDYGNLVSFLKGDIRYYAKFEDLNAEKKYPHLKLINSENNFVRSFFEKPDNVFEAAYIANEPSGSFSIFKKNLDQNIAVLSSQINTSCDPGTDLMCRKKWAALDLSAENIITGARDNECSISKKFEKIAVFTARLGAPVKNIFYFCNTDRIAKIFGHKKDNIFKHLPSYLIGAGSTSFENFLLNESMVLSEGGLLSSKLYSNSPAKDKLPTPSTSYSISRVSHPLSWAYFDQVSSGPITKMPKNKYSMSVNFSSLADIYMKSGNYERALEAQFKAINSLIFLSHNLDFDYSYYILTDLVRLKHILKVLQTPPQLIESIVKEKIKEAELKLNDVEFEDIKINFFFSVSGELLKDQMVKYIQDKQSVHLKLSNDDYSLENSFEFVTNLVIDNGGFINDYCLDQSIAEALFLPKNKENWQNKLGAASWFNSTAIAHEFIDKWHKCAKIYRNRLIKTDQAIIIDDIYSRYLSDFMPDYIRAGFNFSEPRLLSAFDYLALISRDTKNLKGAAIAAIATEHIFSSLVTSFVNNDGRALRLNQKHIESIIVNSEFALRDYMNHAVANDHTAEYLKLKLKQLSSSYKTILSSKNKRERFLGLHQQAAVKTNSSFETFMSKNYSSWPEYINGLGVAFEQNENGVFVSEILEGGGFEQTNLPVGTKILGINDISLKNNNLQSITKAIVQSPSDQIQVHYSNINQTHETITATKNRLPIFAKLQTQRQFRHFVTINNSAEEALTPVEYFEKLALKGSHVLGLSGFPFEGYEFRNWSEIFNPVKTPIVQFSASDGDIVIEILTSEGTVKKLISLEAEKLANARKELASYREPSDEQIEANCNLLKPLHASILPHIQSAVIILPSVNLLPIPSELLIGSFCFDKKISIIHASDLTGAIKWSQVGSGITRPNAFIGIGNPTLNASTETSNLSSEEKNKLRFRGFKKSTYQFEPLPEASEEINLLSTYFNESQIFIESNASVLLGLEKASKLAEHQQHYVIALATHGYVPEKSKGFFLPRLLSLELGKHELLPNSAVERFNLSNSIVLLSACDSAAGLLEESDLLFTGFPESFANAGSTFILASLWPVETNASKTITTKLFENWHDTKIEEAISIAKSAIKDRKRSLPFVFLIP